MGWDFYFALLVCILYTLNYKFYFCCRMFIGTCKRLKIMKGSDPIGLGMYSQHWLILQALSIPNVENLHELIDCDLVNLRMTHNVYV